jgi:hypothetical protein
MEAFDDLGLLLRQAERNGLMCLTVNRRQGRFHAYTEFDQAGATRAYKCEAETMREAALGALFPRSDSLKGLHGGDRLERLEDALGDLLGERWTMNEAMKEAGPWT